ncbi:MAG: hypothetical protein QMD80_02585 [archaeon]|nr:hypothetical protein [archaeon]
MISETTVWGIIGTSTGIIGIILVVLPRFLKRRKVEIKKLYPEKIFPGMALGIQGTGFSPRIETNRITFSQGRKSVYGKDVTGGATAPEEAVLTVEVPADIEIGKGRVTVSNPISRESNALEFEVVESPSPHTFWAVKYPQGVREGSIKCKKCGLEFYVGLFPYDSDDSKSSKDLNYHLKLVKGETEKIERKFLLEDILDRFCHHLHIKNYPIGCFLFILIGFLWQRPH